ncbi:MAG: MacB-like periplasmic core domain protein [Gemmatimonadetes bacterium]|nr:MacB-like periplasmic core domain protein [Gemmatimonadota bacterium]
MIQLLAVRNLTLKPWRTLFLLFGFSMGVAVMIVLLSIGEALLDQSKDEKLVGGGTITVLPEGVDIEVLKTGGLGGLFFSIDHARFIYQQLLAAPRLRDAVSAVSPQIDGKLVYLRTADGRERAVRASGDIPSLTAAVDAAPTLTSGSWSDDTLDRRWRSPTMYELRHEIDRFHLPPTAVAGDPSWAEWHYFNVITPDRRQWAFISFMVAGAVGDSAGRWGGQLLVTLHEQGRSARRFTSIAPSSRIRFSTTDADLRIGESRVVVRPDGRYELHGTAREDRTGAPLTLDLVVSPVPGAYFPGAALGSGVVSGYVVPALRASATGSICVGSACTRYDDVQSYHDHNWGVWRGVTWEWGAARAGQYTFLYGRIEPPDSVASAQPLFVYLVDSSGFVALFRPRVIRYVDERTTLVKGRAIRTPSTAEMVDVRGDDTLRLSLAIEDASASDTREGMAERGEGLAARRLARPYFVQMKGTASIAGRIRGTPLAGSGAGFFETYR